MADMVTFLATFAAFALIVLALGVGLLVDGRRLRGSCGGVGDCHCNAWRARRCPRRAAH
jgi:hypothetical protein